MSSVATLNQKEALTFKEAGQILGVSERQFRKIVSRYPDRFHVFNLLPNGFVKVSRSDIESFLSWRQEVGPEFDQ